MRDASGRGGDERPVRVSFVLSTRNRADHLDRALQGARALVGADDELIVVDGDSTDHTRQVAEKHRDVVTLFLSERDTGEAHGLNRGFLRARGRFLKQLTDDDVFFPDAMRRAVDTLEGHEEVDALVCGGEAHEFDPATGRTLPVEYRYLPDGLRLRDDVAYVMRYTQCGLGLVLRRRVLERTGLFDTTFRAVDTDYMARLIAGGADVRYLHVKLFRHVTYPHSGQNREAECLRDRARVLMRSAAWSRIEEAHDPRALARALGLDALPRGESLALLLWYGERLRRTPVGLLYPPLAAALRLGARATAPLRRIFAGLGTHPTANGRVDLAVEPSWDGSLR